MKAIHYCFTSFTKNISNNCVRILVFYYLLMNYDIFGSHSRHQMLALIKENMICIYNKNLENIAKKYVTTSDVFQQFSIYSLQWRFIRHAIPASIEILRINIRKRDNKIFLTFMLDFCFYTSAEWFMLSKEEHPTFTVI